MGGLKVLCELVVGCGRIRLNGWKSRGSSRLFDFTQKLRQEDTIL